MDKTLIDKFWSKVDKSSECWIWIAGKGRRGTGKFMSGLRAGYTSIASRFSYILHYGEISEELMVCHKCDNPACVNPQHLFLGTHQDNMDDMVKKGRSPRNKPTLGKTLKSKLSESQVRSIRSDGRKLKDIAKEYGVSFQLISRIRLRTAKRNLI